MEGFDVNADSNTQQMIQRALDQITDIYLPESDALGGFIYPKAMPIRDYQFLYDFAYKLLEQSKLKTGTQYDEFVVRLEGYSYRGHRIETVEGFFYALRRMPKSVPTLTDLGLNPALSQILLSESLNKGGLVMICGETGQGKSTTCAATIKERMMKLGSFCLTVEDPPEMPLHGTHGSGRCLQTEVKSGNFAEAMRGAMRCYPTVNGSILYVGETRDAETAAEVLRIAMNGNLVFTTLHANDVPSGLKRILSLASTRMAADDASSILSSVFRVGMHQVLEPMKPAPGQPARKRLDATFLISNSHKTPIANKIRKSEIDALGTDLHQQKALLDRGGASALLRLWE